MYLGFCSAICTPRIGIAEFMDDFLNGSLSAHELVSQASLTTSALATILEVSSGTAEETYSIWLQGLRSVGAPTWLELPPQEVDRVFAFNLNKGPDNMGAYGQVKASIRSKTHFMSWATFCSFHAFHKIDSSISDHLDTWTRLLGTPLEQ